MVLDQVAATARWTAADRAAEQGRPDRLFADPYAAALAGRDAVEFHARCLAEHPTAAAVPYLAIRCRFFDDFLTMAGRAAPAPRQVVVLGAGLDARAFRLPWPAGTRMYELDRPELLGHKERVLAGVRPRCARRPVGADLTGEWTGALREAGFDPAGPAVWLAEGLLTYLTEAEVRRLLAAVATLAAPGSLLGADLVNEVFLSHPYLTEFLALMAEFGAPWRFGSDDPQALFAEYGWRATLTQPGEAGANFGRWPFPPHGRDDAAAPRGFLATAARS